MATYRNEMEGLEGEIEETVPDMEPQRRGGPQVEDEDDDEQKKKMEERERKKKEVRERLAAERAGKKAKKGFLTPERKKKLRKMLMQKAAEDLKQQQMLKEQERKKVLEERTIKMPNIDGSENQDELQKMAEKFYERMKQLEGDKFDIYAQVVAKDIEINEMTIAVCELKGKYVKPMLKKVSKYDNKFKKMLKNKEKEADYSGFRQNLKKSERMDVMDIIKTKKDADNPEWARKKREDAEAEAAAAPKAPRPPKTEEETKAEEEKAAAPPPKAPEPPAKAEEPAEEEAEAEEEE